MSSSNEEPEPAPRAFHVQPSSPDASSSSPRSPRRPVPKPLPVRVRGRTGRAGQPKTRSGCHTCKARRVKCDEGKPFCQRCIRYGTACEGYAKKEPKPAKVATTRILLPKALFLQQLAKLSSPTPNIRIKSYARFSDPLAAQSFRMYLDETARQIHGAFKSSLWDRLIPQISEHVPFVRHAIIAIGSLQKSRSQQQKSPFSGDDYVQYQYALKQYDRSLRSMREAIAAGYHDLRKALIACLLVYCFEGILGNQASAIAHAESGLMLLYHWKHSKTMAKPWKLARTAWEEDYLEREITEAFTALDLQVLCFIDSRSQEIHRQTVQAESALLGTMSRFTDFAGAKEFWQHMINRNYHFSKSLQHYDLTAAHEEREGDSWEGEAKMTKDELLGSSTINGPVTVKQEQMQYRQQIHQWMEATSKIFTEIKAWGNQEEQVGAAILQMQAYTNDIMLAGAFFTSDIEYDVFHPEFTKMVELGEFIYPNLVGRPSANYLSLTSLRFHFDFGIVAALFLVASRCRFDTIRQRAIALLLSANYREGIWDALAVANIAVWLRSIEREDIGEDDFVREEKRAFLTAISIDLHRKKAVVSCSQRINGGLVTRSSSLTW
ncbi:hypothetical protein BP5796_10883 [Coleophoma crateriformis]|uniref:Zn(2)-C6 fungal-type domain-containing protein n=1 Tax=Coleophoma crateriformis TaxID=565419 RepID=A0A3D8QLJ5_9HELO|nr:hypothetical protein BP5796_10883 [Coleophoma crateriformis]